MSSNAIRAWYRLICLGVLLAGSLGLARAAGSAAVIRVYVGIVPPAQGGAFTAGLKTWEKCLTDHGGKERLVTYVAQSGDLDRYLFLEEHDSWADIDRVDPANTACASTFQSEVLTHLSQGFGEVAVLNAKASYLPGDDPDPAPMLWVEAFRLKPGYGEAFAEALTKYAAAATRIHWQTHFGGYDIQGSGNAGEDFVLVAPNRTWAEIGADPKPSVKSMMESVYGKAAARAIHGKFEGAIADEWSDIWSFDKELSYLPAR